MDLNTKVVVTTAHRGVFFGTLESQEANTVVLIEARNCLYWARSAKGFLGLAATGPNSECRVGPAASRTQLFDVTSMSECSDEAARRWEVAPWSS